MSITIFERLGEFKESLLIEFSEQKLFSSSGCCKEAFFQSLLKFFSIYKGT
jgi:hypothetical protein